MALLIVGPSLLAPPAKADDVWRTGASKVVITPEKPMWMSGYAARKHPAEGKLHDLWAKALVTEDPAGHRVALVTLDLMGIGRKLSNSVRDAIEAEHGLARSQVALCTSHTHSGPVVGRNLIEMVFLEKEHQQLIEQYAATLEAKIVEAVGQAIGNLAPSQLSWGTGHASFAINRRNNLERQVSQRRQSGQLVGPVDHDVPVLAVRDKEGRLTAIVFGYACHGTTLKLYQWSGDYPGFAQLALEEKYPDAVALFWAGCGGDQGPHPRRSVELAQQYGKRLATAVERVVEAPLQPISGTLASSYAEIDLPFAKLPSRGELLSESMSSDKYVANRAKLLLAQLDGGEPLSPTYPYPVQLWRLGSDLRFVMLGGEVVVDYAVRLKSELGRADTWVAAYTNDVMAYIPSRRVLAEGGYEAGDAMVYYGLPTVWATQIEESIVDEVHRQVQAN